jgi:glycosyltransferase involved in cell wall biosynthesis
MEDHNMATFNHSSKHRPLVVFGEDWGKHPSSTQHLIKELNNKRKVVWINSIGLRKPKLSWHDLLRVIKKISTFFSFKTNIDVPAEKRSIDFVVINPLVVPCANSWISIKFSRWMLARQLSKQLTALDIENPIVWCSLPTAVDYLALFTNSTCVYYCGDDFGSLAGVDHQVVTEKEVQLVRKVKYIFTASEALLDKFPKDKTITIPHGVNYALFNEKQGKRPADLPPGKSIVGFYGSISTWIDQELILHAAKMLPDWNFVFIGHIECNIDNLLKVSNIHFIGAKNHCDLPNYIQHWNVALLPFKDNKQIQMCNPLKLREYLASGTPIVSTHFNALDEYKSHVTITNNKKDICQAILLANAEVSESMNFNKINDIDALLALTSIKDKREKSVINESWQRRANQIDRYLLAVSA